MTHQLQLEMERSGRLAELDEKVVAALRSNVLTEHDKEILRVIASHQGAMNSIRSAEIALLAGAGLGEEGRRNVTKTIETLVTFFRMPIGGLRMPPYGYFLIVSSADLDLAIQPLWGEVYAHLRRLRALTSKQAVARLFGQAMLKLDEEIPKEAV